MGLSKKDKARLRSTGTMVLKILAQWVAVAWPMVTTTTTWAEIKAPYFVIALIVSTITTLTAVFGDSPLDPKVGEG